MNKRTVNNQFQTCDICETKTRHWNIHHKNGDHSDNRKENLQWLCVDCHVKAHSTQYGMVQSKVDRVNYDLVNDISESHIGYRLSVGFSLLKDDEIRDY